MNEATLTQLVTNARGGDAGALEQLLLRLYTPVSFVCRKLLKDDRLARSMAMEVLQRIAQEFDALPSPDELEPWALKIAAEVCVQAQQERPWLSQGEGETVELPIMGESLDAVATVDAVQKMVDMLPEKPRTCMTLRCCCDLKSDDIAQLTGYTAEDIRSNMGIAQNFVLEQLQKYQEYGTQFYPVTSLADILRSAMNHGDAEEAAAAVYAVMGGSEQEAQGAGRGKKIVLWILIVLMVLLNLMLILLNVIAKNKNTFDTKDYAAVVTAGGTLSAQTVWDFPETVAEAPL